MSWARRHRTGLAVGGGLLAVLVIVWIVFDWNMLRGPIAKRVSAATGRTFAINGDLDVALALRPRVTAHDLVLGNAPWSREPTMVRVRRLTVELDLWRLLTGERVLPLLAVEAPQVLLERNPRGQGNWMFEDRAAREPDQGEPWRIEALRIAQGRLRYLDPQRRSDVTVLADSTAPDADTRDSRLGIRADGRYEALPLSLRGEIGSVMQLQQTLAEGRQPYPVRARGRIGATQVYADGTVRDLRQFDGLAVSFALSGRSLGELYPLIGVPLPATPAYSVEGELRHNGLVWHLTRIAGKVGASDLGGEFRVDRGQKPQFVQADLVSRRLDLKDLSGFIGARDAQSGKTIAVPGSRVLPQTPFNVEKMRTANADVHLKGRRIQTARLPLDDFEAHLVIKDGVATLDPLNFGVAGGDVRSTIRLDSTVRPIRTRADLKVRRLKLTELMPKLDLGERATTGLLGGWAKLDMRGNAVAGMLGSADGDVALLMHGGSTSKLLMRLANLDVANTLGILLTGDEQIEIRCMVADFEARQGKLLARTLVLDTEKQVIRGEGQIDLKNEQIDLRLRARPKDISLAALRGPIVLSGPLGKPQVRPSLPQPTGRTAIAAALAAVAPPLALLPLIDLGGAEDTPCAALLKNPRAAGKAEQAGKADAAPQPPARARTTPTGIQERRGTWNRAPLPADTPTRRPQ
ncbi:AsmA family protein [Chitiniphilus purpureus]|uniref:AsmA family protein n=1 Tax=Chitiniphilus purpureus TaxID=2981137 RepID=A0ABY6DMB0_9NEIS|nr:AsmA family protein [Chitiniphilus sp. CD1]UXY15348.1 AsmA family protein [Chitiniphilus sp. CD1]